TTLASKVGETMEKAGQTNLAELVGERPPHFVTTLRKPVIAAINGSCVGLGVTPGADVRSTVCGRRGHVPGRVCPPRADRRVRHLLDTSALDPLGRRPRP